VRLSGRKDLIINDHTKAAERIFTDKIARNIFLSTSTPVFHGQFFQEPTKKKKLSLQSNGVKGKSSAVEAFVDVDVTASTTSYGLGIMVAATTVGFSDSSAREEGERD
jgi:hypothetical protein